MRSLWRVIVAGSALVSGLPASRLVAQGGDQWVGTWKLDVAKSKYTPAPGPKSLTVVITKAGAGFTFAATGVGGDGKPTSTEFTTMLDGKDVAVTGSPDYDMVSVKMLNPMTRHMVRKKGGKEVQTVHSVLSKDGKHFTSTTTGINAKGAKVSATFVFDRQ